MDSGGSGKGTCAAGVSFSEASILDANEIGCDMGILGRGAPADWLKELGESKYLEDEMLMMLMGRIRGELVFSSSRASWTGWRIEGVSVFLSSRRTSLDSCSFVLGLINRTANPGDGWTSTPRFSSGRISGCVDMFSGGGKFSRFSGNVSVDHNRGEEEGVLFPEYDIIPVGLAYHQKL